MIYTYQWRRHAVDITGATGSTYRLVHEDDRADVDVVVTATNDGATGSAVSAPVRVAYKAPSVIADLANIQLEHMKPSTTVSGSAAFSGGALTFGITGAGASIDAATGTATLSAAQLLANERITVTARNSGGTASASFFLTVTAVTATNEIFVAASGSDANGGRSQGAPVRTLARALKLAASGDTVALRRGDVWRETLVITQSGLSFVPYGTGAAPIISGADPVAGWASAGNNVWTASLGANPIQVFVNGERAERRASVSEVSTAGRWHWSSGTLRVFSTTTPIVEATVRESAVNTDGRTGTRLSGLRIERARIGITANAATGLTVENCSITGCYTQGINGGGPVQTNDVVIRGNTITDIAGTGIGFGGRIENWTIEANTISGCAQLTQHVVEPVAAWRNTFQFTSGIKIWGWSEPGWTGRYEIRDNTIRDIRPRVSWATVGATASTHGVGIWLDEAYPATGVRPQVLRNVVLDCNSRGIFLEKVDNHDVAFNVIHGCATQAFAGSLTLEANHWGWDLKSDTSAIVPRDARNNRIRHNTVVGGYWCFHAVAADTNCHLVDNEVSNNIFLKTDGITGFFHAGAANIAPSGTGNRYRTNSWGAARTGWIRWGGWEASHVRSSYASLPAEFEGHVAGDPLLADPARGNFSLRTGSPCIGAAPDGSNLGAR